MLPKPVDIFLEWPRRKAVAEGGGRGTTSCGGEGDAFALAAEENGAGGDGRDADDGGLDS